MDSYDSNITESFSLKLEKFFNFYVEHHYYTTFNTVDSSYKIPAFYSRPVTQEVSTRCGCMSGYDV